MLHILIIVFHYVYVSLRVNIIYSYTNQNANNIADERLPCNSLNEESAPHQPRGRSDSFEDYHCCCLHYCPG